MFSLSLFLQQGGLQKRQPQHAQRAAAAAMASSDDGDECSNNRDEALQLKATEDECCQTFVDDLCRWGDVDDSSGERCQLPKAEISSRDRDDRMN
jgi:hypothetical protein